jgi:hypothetical protein
MWMLTSTWDINVGQYRFVDQADGFMLSFCLCACIITADIHL